LHPAHAGRLIDELAQLDPKANDLKGWTARKVPPTAELLAAVRRNSKLAAWLSALPASSTSGLPPTIPSDAALVTSPVQSENTYR
jgi:hypothetical protein